MALGYWQGLGLMPAEMTTGTGTKPFMTGEPAGTSLTPVTDVAPVVGTTTGPLVTGTPAGESVGISDFRQLRPDIDPGIRDDLGLDLPTLDHRTLDRRDLTPADPGPGYDDSIVPAKKFPTALLVGGGVAALALLWMVMRK